jgi:hypothetical protein
MGRAKLVGRELDGSEKAIGRLGGRRGAAGLGNAGGRVGQLIGHNTKQTLGEAGVAQVGGRKLLGSRGLTIWQLIVHHVRLPNLTKLWVMDRSEERCCEL